MDQPPSATAIAAVVISSLSALALVGMGIGGCFAVKKHCHKEKIHVIPNPTMR